MKCGLGLHVAEVEAVSPDLPYYFRKLLYVIDLHWVTLVTLIKLSILHFYLKMFYNPIFKRAVLVVMGLCVAFWFGAFFGTALFCIPPRALWEPLDNVPEAHCGNNQAMYAACASSDLGIDVIVISLPMPILWGLQLPAVKKVALTFVFGLGFFIIGVTSARIKFMLELDASDSTYSISTITLLSALVPLLGFINANLPVLPPVLKKIFRSSLGWSSGGGPSSGSGGYNKKSAGNNTIGSARSHQFERLGEESAPEIPLVSFNKHHSRALRGDDKVERPPGNQHSTEGADEIYITRDWEVRSVSAGTDAPSNQTVVKHERV